HERERIQAWQASNTETCGGELGEQLKTIDRHTRINAHDVTATKRPGGWRLRTTHDQATLLLELTRSFRFTCLLEVIGASKHAHALRHFQAPHDQPRILERTNADRDVEPFLDGIHTT